MGRWAFTAFKGRAVVESSLYSYQWPDDGLPSSNMADSLPAVEYVSPRRSRYLGAIQRNRRAQLIQAGELKLGAAVKFARTTVAYSGPDKPHLNNSHIAALLLSPEFTHRESAAPLHAAPVKLPDLQQRC